MKTRGFLAVLVAAVLLGVGACSAAGAPTVTTTAAITPALDWLTNAEGPAKLYHDGVPTAWHSTWAIMNTGNCDPLPPGAVPVYWFGDYDTFADAVATGQLDGRKPTPNCVATKDHPARTFRFKAVVVDYENWPATPAVDRKYWRHYVTLAYQLAHQHGLIVIQAMTHGVPGDSDANCTGWAGYFTCGAPHYEAQYADMVDIQAQHEEGTPAFVKEITTGSEQARQANAKVVVLAGMRSSAAGTGTSCPTKIPATTITTDWYAVAAKVSGAWLNVNCDEHTFVPLLRKLYG